MTVKALVLWLALSIPVIINVPVYFEHSPSGTGWLGLSCAVGFRDKPGNVQQYCDHGDGTYIILYDTITTVDMMKNILSHEQYHLRYMTMDEGLAYRYGCKIQWVDACYFWLTHYWPHHPIPKGCRHGAPLRVPNPASNK